MTIPQSKLQSRISGLYKKLDELRRQIGHWDKRERVLQKKTTQTRLKRDEFKEQRQILLQEATEARQKRDQLNEVVSQAKRSRDSFQEKSTEMFSGIKRSWEISEEDKKSVTELKYQLYLLEYEQQTKSLPLAEEESLLTEIERLEEVIKKREEEGRLEGEFSPIDEEVLQELKVLKEEAQSSHEKMLELNQQAQSEHKKVSLLYSKIDKLREKEQESHDRFVDNLSQLEETRKQIQHAENEITEILEHISTLKKDQKTEKIQEKEQAISNRIKSLLEKRDRGEDLSPEEMEFLLGMGHVPF